MTIKRYDRSDDYYLLVFNLDFSELSEKKMRVLKRAKLFLTSGEYILVIADKYNAGIIINELLEENVVLMYPNVSMFEVEFSIKAMREPGILSELLKSFDEIPVLGVFSLASKIYIIVDRRFAEKVGEILAKLIERTLLCYNLAF